MSFTCRHRGDPGHHDVHGRCRSALLLPILGSLVTYGYIRQPSAPADSPVTELLDLFQRLSHFVSALPRGPDDNDPVRVGISAPPARCLP
ncbi:MAG: hypothetical protein M0C28_16750 [Candidatus Moduliflexus flocculans]|nr:hypothetical protein [Candidatus Moduliflexus flocculans]